MDPTKMLEADHRQVESLFAQIEKTEGRKRESLIHDLQEALHGHMELEERTLYEAMATVTGAEEVQEADTEHQLARKALAEMVRLGPDEPGFGAAMEATKAGIEHHVHEEEGEVFPKLRAHGKVLDSIATAFMQTRLELGLPMDADALSVASTKEELLAEAKSAGIEGASSMNKEELAGALAQVMAGA